MSEKICTTDGCENAAANNRSKCQTCLTAQHNDWRRRNIETQRVKVREYRAKNAEYFREIEKTPERRAKQNKARKRRLASDPEARRKNAERAKAYYDAHRDDPEWRKKNNARIRTPEQRNREHLKRHYRITPEEYDVILASQNGCCALCEKPPSEGERRLSVDHCHSSNKVRQLLCRFCNVLVGHLEGKPELVQRAYEYIARHAIQSTE